MQALIPKQQGQLILEFNKDYTELHYKLIVANINDVTEAHIHGMDNMIVAPLAINGISNGTIAEGVITSISCHPGEPLGHLVECINHGHIYVDVHTTQKPDGEIKGQVK